MMNDEKVTLAAGSIVGILWIIMFIVIVAYFVFAGGYVLSILWGWFIIPVFTTAPALTWQQAAGIILVASFFKYKPKDSEKSNNKTTIMLLLYPWLLLLFGYIIKIVLF